MITVHTIDRVRTRDVEILADILVKVISVTWKITKQSVDALKDIMEPLKQLASQ